MKIQQVKFTNGRSLMLNPGGGPNSYLEPHESVDAISIPCPFASLGYTEDRQFAPTGTELTDLDGNIWRFGEGIFRNGGNIIETRLVGTGFTRMSTGNDRLYNSIDNQNTYDGYIWAGSDPMYLGISFSPEMYGRLVRRLSEMAEAEAGDTGWVAYYVDFEHDKYLLSGSNPTNDNLPTFSKLSGGAGNFAPLSYFERSISDYTPKAIVSIPVYWESTYGRTYEDSFEINVTK